MLAFLCFVTVIVMLAADHDQKSHPHDSTDCSAHCGVISSWFRVTDAEAAPGVMNILPWGTPTIRAAAAMQMDVMELSQPVLIPVLCGLVCVIIFSIILGGKEKGRIGSVALASAAAYNPELTEEEKELVPQPFYHQHHSDHRVHPGQLRGRSSRSLNF